MKEILYGIILSLYELFIKIFGSLEAKKELALCKAQTDAFDFALKKLDEALTESFYNTMLAAMDMVKTSTGKRITLPSYEKFVVDRYWTHLTNLCGYLRKKRAEIVNKLKAQIEALTDEDTPEKARQDYIHTKSFYDSMLKKIEKLESLEGKRVVLPSYEELILRRYYTHLLNLCTSAKLKKITNILDKQLKALNEKVEELETEARKKLLNMTQESIN